MHSAFYTLSSWANEQSLNRSFLETSAEEERYSTLSGFELSDTGKTRQTALAGDEKSSEGQKTPDSTTAAAKSQLCK